MSYRARIDILNLWQSVERVELDPETGVETFHKQSNKYVYAIEISVRNTNEGETLVSKETSVTNTSNCEILKYA